MSHLKSAVTFIVRRAIRKPSTRRFYYGRV